jgi:ABC-type transporter Mla subunit MlaD
MAIGHFGSARFLPQVGFSEAVKYNTIPQGEVTFATSECLMATNLPPVNLVQLVETLKDQEQRYIQATEAITRTLEDQRKQQRDSSAAIADTLNRISGLLSALVGSASPALHRQPVATPSKLPGKVVAKATVKTQAPKAAGMRSAKAGKYATTGPESVLAFIRERGNPTTAELTQHWKGEGRGGKVENILGQMVKAKKLKRTPNPAGRGSRYSLP